MKTFIIESKVTRTEVLKIKAESLEEAMKEVTSKDIPKRYWNVKNEERLFSCAYEKID